MNEVQARKKFGFSDNLPILRLDEVVWFQEGPGVRKHQFVNKGIKLLNVANIEKNEMNLNKSKNYISNDEANGKYSHFLAETGDLVIASSGIKIKNFDEKIAFIRKEHLPLCMNTSTIRFRSLDDNKLDIQYFSWFLRSDCFKKQVQFWVTGSAQLNFGPSHLKKMYVCVPCLKKQQQISQTLDLTDNLRQKRKKQLALLDDYLKSVFWEMFGDPEKFPKCKIKSIAANRKYSLSSGPFGSNLTSKDYVKEGVIVLRGLNVSKGPLDISNVKYILEKKANELIRSEVVPNDIVIVAVGSSGLALRIPEILPRAIMSQNFNKISPNTDKINPLFLQFYINSDFVQRQFRKKITDTVRTFLSLTKIKDVDIILPPIEMQDKFSDIVEQVEKTKQKMRVSLDEMDNHFNALMQKYFG